jgi:serine protease Do
MNLMHKIALTLAAIAGLTIPLGATPYSDPGVDVPSGGSYLGVGIFNIDAERAKVLKLSEGHGVEVSKVDPNSPAAKAGIQMGDILLSFNGQSLDGVEQLGHLVKDTPAGTKVKILVWRAGKTEVVSAIVEARKDKAPEATGVWRFPPPDPSVMAPDVVSAYPSWHSRMLGVECESVGNQLAEYFGVKQGVLIRAVVKGSAAEHAGLKAGDVVTKIGEHPVASPLEIRNALRERNAQTVNVAITRDHKDVTLPVTFEDASRISPRTNMPQ